MGEKFLKIANKAAKCIAIAGVLYFGVLLVLTIMNNI